MTSAEMPGLIAIGALGTEFAAEQGATPAHFLAAGTVLVAVVGVVKGYAWATRQVKDIVGEAIALHGAQDAVRSETIRADIAAARNEAAAAAKIAADLASELRSRPCISCNTGACSR